MKVPGDWDTVGGIVPDLILYDDDDKPVRIIEVVVTSPPDDRKRKKLDTLRGRGIDVVEITVTKESDLLALCWTPWTPTFTSLTRRDKFADNRAQDEYRRLGHRRQDEKVQDLIFAIQNCSPKVRRDFWKVFKHLGTLDSLYPVRPNNPYRRRLEE